jgi:hypothetical protein
MSLERTKNLVLSFNNGNYDEDIEPYFNNVLTFFKVVKKYDILDAIDVNAIPSSELDEDVFKFLMENNVITSSDYDYLPNEFRNYYLLHGLEHDYESTVIFITDELLNDVEIRPDGFYLHLRDREELADFFCSSSRYTSASDIAKIIFGEDSHEWYYNDYTEPSEVIDVLNDSNITKLKDVIYKQIGDKELSLGDYDTDFFESLSENQGTEGYFRIRPEDLNGLLDDSDSMNQLFNDELSDLGSELSNLYNMSENTSYEDEVYSLVYDGLSEYFDGNVTETPREVTLRDGTKKTRYDNHIKIRDFVGDIETFLSDNAGSGYNFSNLDYYGSYTTLIKDNDSLFECINFRIPDYPDYTQTVKNVNEYFTDYI